MGLLVNELMASHFKGLDKDATPSSFLDRMLHRLTPTRISSIVLTITFDLITIFHSNMNHYIDAMSGGILTGGILYMGNLYSTMTLHKISSAVIIQKSITL